MNNMDMVNLNGGVMNKITKIIKREREQKKNKSYKEGHDGNSQEGLGWMNIL